MHFPISRHQVFVLLALLFFGFICYIIICADTGQTSHLTRQVRHLPFGDKAGHFILYGLLALLVNLALQNRRIQIGTKLLLAGSFYVAVFAVAEEFTQLFLASRTFELVDIACDFMGIFAFSLFAPKPKQ